MSKKILIKNPKKDSKDKPKSPQDWVMKMEGTKRFSLDLPTSLHADLKISSVKQGKTMGVMMKECLEKYLIDLKN